MLYIITHHTFNIHNSVFFAATMPEILIFSDKIISLSYYLRTNKIDTSPLTQSISPTVQSEDPTVSISPQGNPSKAESFTSADQYRIAIRRIIQKDATSIALLFVWQI
ncbi:hypothetical protein PLUA15_220079 [Pseudomonas lundensis]|uniref:Uncharacterized protein n=1 Tax=Pseudomonas lundensis TaxID=86185 RepID=A0AAX2H5L7_9PSED|nr:hypothetical protein PLUA15_220079 [Pseudomonas lundensis]